MSEGDKQIIVLPETVASRIAAGEVVERPASAVKELIENSLDAAARSISITVEQGGKSLIRVSDDGYGMVREDLELCVRRHATSKIRDASDLSEITSLGFRGEALPSICSVSRAVLTSRTHDSDVAWRLVVDCSKMKPAKPVGASPGTTVEVRSLFKSVPARRKFLKSDRAENTACVTAATRLAISSPDVAFLLECDGRKALDLPAAQDLRARLASIFPRDVVSSLLPVESGETGYFSVRGFVSPPSVHRANRTAIFAFLNGRFIQDRLVSGALARAYENRIPHGRHPMAVLFLEVPPREVDVNVHPMKFEVRFRSPGSIFSLVHLGICEALGTAEGTSVAESASSAAATASTAARKGYGDAASSYAPRRGAHGFGSPSRQDLLSVRSLFGGRRAEGVDWDAPPLPVADSELQVEPASGKPETPDGGARAGPESSAAGTAVSPAPGSRAATVPAEAAESPVQADATPEGAAKETLDHAPAFFIGRLAGEYLLAELHNTLIIIDLHALHERIIFDRLNAPAQDAKKEVQGFLVPATVELSVEEASAADAALEQLQAIGFDVERFGGRSVIVRAVPSGVGPVAAEKIVRELCGRIASGDVAHGAAALHAKEIVACRAAVKLTDRLPDEELAALIRQAEARYGSLLAPAASTCPHGRPTVIAVTRTELARKFGRKS